MEELKELNINEDILNKYISSIKSRDDVNQYALSVIYERVNHFLSTILTDKEFDFNKPKYGDVMKLRSILPLGYSNSLQKEVEK